MNCYKESKKIYSKKSYMIIKVSKGFVVYNSKKQFNLGHTHINNYHVAKTLIDCSSNKKLPKTNSKYLLESLIRISTDEEYINNINQLIRS